MRSPNIAVAVAAAMPSLVAADGPLVNLHWGAREHPRRLADICAADDRPDIITITGPCVSPVSGFLDTSEECREMRADLAACKAGNVRVLARVGKEELAIGRHEADRLADSVWATYVTDAGVLAVDGFDVVITDDFDDQVAWVSFAMKLGSLVRASDEVTWLAASPSRASSADASRIKLLGRGVFNALFLDFSEVPSSDGLPTAERPDVLSYKAWEDVLESWVDLVGSSNANTKLFLGLSNGAATAEDEAGLVAEIMSNGDFTHFGGVSVWEEAGDTPEGRDTPQLEMELRKRSNLAPRVATPHPDDAPAYIVGSKRSLAYMPVNTAALFARQAGEEGCGGGEPSPTASGTAGTSDSTVEPTGTGTGTGSAATGTGTGTDTLSPTGIDTGAPGSTGTETPSPTGTGTADPTGPEPTGTLDPSETDTSKPTGTGTLDPPESDTSSPTGTGTLDPSGTDTSKPTGTGTQDPPSSDEPTDTSRPTGTGTLDPPSSDEPTDTSKPTGTGTQDPPSSDEPTDTSGPSGTETPTGTVDHSNTDGPSGATHSSSTTKTISETKTYTITSCPPNKGSCEEGDVTSIVTTYTTVCPVTEDPEPTSGAPPGDNPSAPGSTDKPGHSGADDEEPGEHGPGVPGGASPASPGLTTPGAPRPTGPGGFETRPTAAGTGCVGAGCAESPGSTEVVSPDAPAQAGAGRSDLGLVVALVAALAL